MCVWGVDGGTLIYSRHIEFVDFVFEFLSENYYFWGMIFL